MLSLDCTFLITPFVLFFFVLCIVPNAVSGLYILDYPPFVLFVFVLCIEIKNKQTRDSIGKKTKKKKKQKKGGNQECTIQRQHWAQYKEQRQKKQKG
jgi:hypothetical protein